MAAGINGRAGRARHFRRQQSGRQRGEHAARGNPVGEWRDTNARIVSDPALTVGTPVVSGATKLGRIADLAVVERQALSRYTNDAGNHVTIQLRAAPVTATG